MVRNAMLKNKFSRPKAARLKPLCSKPHLEKAIKLKAKSLKANTQITTANRARSASPSTARSRLKRQLKRTGQSLPTLSQFARTSAIANAAANAAMLRKAKANRMDLD